MFTSTIKQDITLRVLPNGITVSLESIPHVRSVSAGVWIRTGSVDEEDRESGVSHFLEHLFFKGTKRRSARQLVEAIESKGGQFNAFTSREYTCIYAKTLDMFVSDGIEILADVIKNSQFYDLEKERNVVLEEIASAEDVPEEYVHDLLAGRFWPGHALGRPIAGFHETVSALDYDAVRRFYERWYRPENMYVSVAGNFDVEAVFDQIARELGEIPAGSPPARPGPPTIGAGVFQVERDIAQSHLCLSFPSPMASDQRRYPADVLSILLGGGSTSRLFERIREESGLAYSVYAFRAVYSIAGQLGIYAAVAPDNLEQTIELAFAEIRNLRDEPVSEYELNLNKDQLKGAFLMGLEGTSTRMSRMAKSLMYHGRIVPVDEIVRNVDAVTAGGLHELAREQFQPEHCALVALGPANGRLSKDLPL